MEQSKAVKNKICSAYLIFKSKENIAEFWPFFLDYVENVHGMAEVQKIFPARFLKNKKSQCLQLCKVRICPWRICSCFQTQKFI